MENNNKPLVLAVAGLDSGGGAGISADCISIHDNHAFALPCVSALTCQSLKSIDRVTSTDEQTFENTLKIAVRDWECISAVKVGLVSDLRLLNILLSYLEGDLKDVPVIWDPVLCGTAGDLNSVDLKANLDRILPLVTIFTPNLIEALALSGWTEDTLKEKGTEALARVFIQKGCQAVIIKGGHAVDNQDAKDLFMSDEFTFTMTCPRVEGEGAHGGGCALSSALAALVANGFALHDAAVIAKAYVYSGIKNPAFSTQTHRPPLGHNGFVNALSLMPVVEEKGFPKSSEPFLKCPARLGLYPVVDSVEWIDRLTALGVRTIQLRIKDKTDPKLYDKIEEAVKICSLRKARLFIDDHYELAIKAHAYGVHLGMEDLKEADISAILKAGLRLGVSTHGAYEMLKALQLNPSYVALGHIFATQSKIMPSKPQGPFKLKCEMNLIKESMPTVAIGGIKLHNLDSVLETGVGSVALITGITKSDDPDRETEVWLSKCSSGGDLEV